VRYVAARYRRESEEFAYRQYVTDSLFYLARGSSLQEQWAVAVRSQARPTKDAGTMVDEIIASAGLVVTE
jgi:hypothetical protein